VTSVPPSSTIEKRRDQMFPILEASEIERVRRFGSVRCFDAGEALEKVGVVGYGLVIILAGEVEVTQRDRLGNPALIVSHGPGAFMGETGATGGSASVGGRLRKRSGAGLDHSAGPAAALFIAEAELGERIMPRADPAPCRPA